MKFEIPNSLKTLTNQKESNPSNPVEALRTELGQIFDEYHTPHERIDAILQRVGVFLEHFNKNIVSLEKIEEIKNSLGECINITEKELFITRVANIFSYFITLKEKYPQDYEEAQSKISNQKQGYIELNRLITYQKEGDIIELHHSMAKTIGPSRKLYDEAMEKLAEVVQHDPEIKKIQAVSWIVHKTPTLFTRAGFTVEFIPKYKPSFNIELGSAKDQEGRKLGMAWISREDFLQRFLLKKQEKRILEIFYQNSNQEIDSSMLSNIPEVGLDKTDIVMSLAKLQKNELIYPLFKIIVPKNGLKTPYVKNTYFKITEAGRNFINKFEN